MSIEKIPAKYQEFFDLYADVDHESVRDYTLVRLNQKNDLLQSLQYAYDRNAQKYPDFIRRLIERGKFLEPVNEELDFIDDEMSVMRVYNTGLAMASVALDALAYEMGVDESIWRNKWVELPENADFVYMRADEQCTNPQECAQIGERLVELGQKSYDALEPPYQQLYSAVADTYETRLFNPQVLRSSFGFIMCFGRNVIYSFSTDERLDKAVRDVLVRPIDDRQVRHLLPKRELRRARRDLLKYHRSQE